jgi:small-conductance mechanosensitive channel
MRPASSPGVRAVRETWTRVAIAGGMIVVTAGAAKLIDSRMSRRELAPGVATRYRVLRRSIFTLVVFIGVLSALLVIPQVRAIAGGILASSAVLGLVIGLAAQRTLGNFVAGLLIAFTQPIRLGDEIEVEGTRGTVEEIGLTYTWLRMPGNDRLVIPNEKLASETIRNSTIRSPETLVEVTVHAPLAADLAGVLAALTRDRAEAFVADLGSDATIVVRRWVPAGVDLDRVRSDLRLAVVEQLRVLGLIAGKDAS